jgi:hypothetical protein
MDKKDERPKRLPVNAEAIPEELKTLPQWCLWNWEQRERKWTKPPYQITGAPAKSNDPETWASFNDVLKTYQIGKFDGIGFMLTPPYVGIDLDSCINPQSKEPQDWARAILGEFNAYSEVSPSGRGYKILCRGHLDKGHHGPKIGVFQNARYFCITGHVLNGFGKIEERQVELDALIRREWPQDLEDTKSQEPAKGNIEDNRLVDKMLGAANGEKVLALMNGDTTGYPSPSEADQALVNHLVFYTQDPLQIDRIFRTSGLYRDKWDRADYRERTIKKALASVKETYQEPGAKGTPTMAELREYMDFNVSGGQFFTADEICRALAANTRDHKIAVYKNLSRLVDEKILRKDPYRHGGFRKILQISAYDMSGRVEENELTNVRLPLDLHMLVKIEPNHLISIAGSTDAGKSAFLYHLMKLNYKNHKILHFTSPEWDQNAIKKRMDELNIERPHPNITCYQMLEGYEDLIPQEPCLVLVDYLRTNEKFNELDRQYHAILRNLKGGVAFCAIQKHIGSDRPTGGQYAVHAAHHVILLDTWKDLFVCKIFKTKNEHQLKGLYRLFNYRNLLLNPLMRDWKKGEIKWENPKTDNADNDTKDTNDGK